MVYPVTTNRIHKRCKLLSLVWNINLIITITQHCQNNFSIFEEGNYGQNVSFTIPQSKEERENGERKQYVANGKIYYASDDLQSFVQRTKKAEEAKELDDIDDDMLF